MGKTKHQIMIRQRRGRGKFIKNKRKAVRRILGG